MIQINGVTPSIPQSLPFSFDLGEYLLRPQCGYPGYLTPPATPPEAYASDPGTIHWPAGASRFALAQFLVTHEELGQIRLTLPTTAPYDGLQPVTLTIGGPGTGQDAVAASMLLLGAVPIVNAFRAAAAYADPPETFEGLYLLLLVDWRYRLAYVELPDGALADTTNWADFDAAVETLLETLASPVVVEANEITAPSSGTATLPGYALAGRARAQDVDVYLTPGLNAAALIDAACLATGRRLVSTFAGGAAIVQASTAISSAQTLFAQAFDSVREGNYDSWPVLTEPDAQGDVEADADPRTVPLTDRFTATLPRQVTLLYPKITAAVYDGDERVAVPIDQAALEAAGLLPQWLNVRYVDELNVRATAWYDTDTVHTQYAEEWAKQFWAWSALNCWASVTYSGVPSASFPETGCDVRVRVTPSDLTTRVYRRPVNDRPGTLHVRSETAGPTPGAGGGSGVTVNYIAGSTVNVNNSTLNVTNNSSLNVDDSDLNVTNNSTLFVDDTSTIAVAGNLLFTPITIPILTGDVTNLNPGANSAWLLLSADAHFWIVSGIVGGVHGRVLTLTNVGTKVILLANEGAGAVAGDKILTSTGVGYYYLSPGHSVVLRYVGLAVNRWRVAENSKEWLHRYEDIALTADVGDVPIDPEREIHVFYPDAEGWLVTGFANGLPGLRKTIRNGADDVGFWLAHNDVTSSAENRLFLPFGEPLYVPARSQVEIQYDGDPAVSRWRVYHVPTTLEEEQIGYGGPENRLTGSYDWKRVDEGEVTLSRNSDTDFPVHRLTRRRANPLDHVEAGDVMGEVIFEAGLGLDQARAYVRGRYTGDIDIDGGQLELGVVSTAFGPQPAITIDREGLVYVDTANAVEELVGTGDGGQLRNYELGDSLEFRDLGGGLAELAVVLGDTYIGYGNASDELTGTADLIRSAEGVVVQTRASNSDATVAEHRLVRTRSSAGSVNTGDVAGQWVGAAKINGTPNLPLGYARVDYAGSGTTQDGTYTIGNYDSGSACDGLTIEDDGDVVILNASTPSSQLHTDADGRVVAVTPDNRNTTLIGCRVYSSGGTTLTNANQYYSIAMASEVFDTAGFHSTSSNTSRITIPTGYAGWYNIRGRWGPDWITPGLGAGVTVRCRLLLNGSFTIDYSEASTGVIVAPLQVQYYYLNEGDYVELQGSSSSAGMQTFTQQELTWLEAVLEGV